MTDRTQEMMAAIYTTLSGDATLTALLGSGRVFNGVPAGQHCPYVDIGESTGNNYHTSSGDAQEHTITIHCWTEQEVSGKSAKLQLLEIVKRVRDLLHYQSIALSAGNMPSLWCEFTEPATRDPDGVSWHGVLRFRAVTEN
jgi:hypothetical protein